MANNDPSARWALIVCAALIQMIAGAVYAMGAWQSALRDALGLTSAEVTSIGAATFFGSVLSLIGGRSFDAFGPRVACGLGGALFTLGYAFIGFAIIAASRLTLTLCIVLPAVGSALAGYSSVSLLDNVVW